MKKNLLLIAFILIVLIIGLVIGYTTSPAAWYGALNKPMLTPPNYLFAPIWTTLYVLIAITGWRVFVQKPNMSLSVLWIVQMCLNFLWSPIFFGMQMLGTALVICAILFITVAIFIVRASKIDKPSALMFVPYIIWLGLATYLNAGVYFLN